MTQFWPKAANFQIKVDLAFYLEFRKMSRTTTFENTRIFLGNFLDYQRRFVFVQGFRKIEVFPLRFQFQLVALLLKRFFTCWKQFFYLLEISKRNFPGIRSAFSRAILRSTFIPYKIRLPRFPRKSYKLSTLVFAENP